MKNIILIIGLFWIMVIQVSGFVILYQAIKPIKTDISEIKKDYDGVTCTP